MYILIHTDAFWRVQIQFVEWQIFMQWCMKFTIKAKSSAAIPQDILVAYRQSNMLLIANLTMGGDITSMKQLALYMMLCVHSCCTYKCHRYSSLDVLHSILYQWNLPALWVWIARDPSFNWGKGRSSFRPPHSLSVI
jgi:hypothetical protein